MSLTPNTKTNLYTLGIVASCVLVLGLWFERRFSSLEAKATATSADIAAIKAEQYTVSMAVEQAFRLAMANPDLAVPDPRNPSIMIQVQKMKVTGEPQP